MNARATRRYGAIGQTDGSVLWRVWAPSVKRVELVLQGGDHGRAVPMRQEPGGNFSHAEPGIAEGQRYPYRLDGRNDRPDPCSLWQPDGVHGPVRGRSAGAVPLDRRRPGRASRREDLVIYELHVGTFTPRGHVRRRHPAAAATCASWASPRSS